MIESTCDTLRCCHSANTTCAIANNSSIKSIRTHAQKSDDFLKVQLAIVGIVPHFLAHLHQEEQPRRLGAKRELCVGCNQSRTTQSISSSHFVYSHLRACVSQRK